MTDEAPAPANASIPVAPLRLRDGDVIDGRTVRNAGNGFVRADRPVRTVTLRRIEVDGGYRVFENYAAGGLPDATIDGLTIEDVVATGLQRGFARIRYDSRHGVIRRIRATGTGASTGKDLPCGIAFEDSAHDFTIEDCVMRDFRMTRGDDHYWNGDGYSSELGNYGLRFLRCEAHDCTDGGFDLKSTGTFLDGCIAGGNKLNYRFWNTLDAHVITSITPVKRGGTGGAGHVQVMATDSLQIHIAKLVVTSANDAPVLLIQGTGATVVIDAHDISVPGGTVLVKAGDGNRVVWKSGEPRL